MKLFYHFSLTCNHLVYLTLFLIYSTCSCTLAWNYLTNSFVCWWLLKLFLSTVIFYIICLFQFTGSFIFLVRYNFLKHFLIIYLLIIRSLKILILSYYCFLSKYLLNIILFFFLLCRCSFNISSDNNYFLLIWLYWLLRLDWLILLILLSGNLIRIIWLLIIGLIKRIHDNLRVSWRITNYSIRLFIKFGWLWYFVWLFYWFVIIKVRTNIKRMRLPKPMILRIFPLLILFSWLHWYLFISYFLIFVLFL